MNEGLQDFPQHAPIPRIDPELPSHISLAAISHFNAVLELGRETRRPGAP